MGNSGGRSGKVVVEEKIRMLVREKRRFLRIRFEMYQEESSFYIMANYQIVIMVGYVLQ